MLGRPQDVDAELLRGGRDEGAAVRMDAGALFGFPVGLARFPIDVEMRGPVVLDVEAIQLLREPLAGRRDLVSVRNLERADGDAKHACG